MKYLLKNLDRPVTVDDTSSDLVLLADTGWTDDNGKDADPHADVGCFRQRVFIAPIRGKGLRVITLGDAHFEARDGWTTEHYGDVGVISLRRFFNEERRIYKLARFKGVKQVYEAVIAAEAAANDARNAEMQRQLERMADAARTASFKPKKARTKHA